ncbi:trehalose-6-phosphate synthase [Streptomyces sp. NPDC006879]|uniref:alpha,alpha-trehalose-phosphate synthase (UDP-forming) n=1 Tax=Streptomyces sp. NPDC006879 TaxID=3364767 RepID=UPI003683375D
MATQDAQENHQVLVASNRGPLSYHLASDGGLDSRRGGGGLVSGLSDALGQHPGALWVCAALSEGDREAVRRDVLEPGVRMLDIDPTVYSEAYNQIANSVLWFTHHTLYQIPLEPVFDAAFRRHWESFRAYNTAFATALAESAGEGARVLIQDYHLALAPGMLRQLRPDVRIAHFTHTPWAPPDYFGMLPADIRSELLDGMLGADHLGFHTAAWAEAFTTCAERYGHTGSAAPRVAAHPLGVEAEDLRALGRRPVVEERLTELREAIGDRDRKTIVRVDRTELSKNILRGLLAYRELLATRPEWHGRVVHLAFAYPSRQDLASYRSYTAAVSQLAEEINEEYATGSWRPVVLYVKDDFPRSLAAYRLADVALINPVRDGMNLVAKEMPVLSDAGVALVLSREAGAYAELGEDAICVNPYDVSETARALHEALTMPPAERTVRTKRLAAAATAMPPRRWFEEQLTALWQD